MTKKYVLYMGLNDKDSKVQKIEIVEAYKMTENILESLGFEGATIFNAVGLYKHQDGSGFVHENTLRIEILDFQELGIKKLVETLKLVFNQESIAVETSIMNSELM